MSFSLTGYTPSPRSIDSKNHFIVNEKEIGINSFRELRLESTSNVLKAICFSQHTDIYIIKKYVDFKFLILKNTFLVYDSNFDNFKYVFNIDRNAKIISINKKIFDSTKLKFKRTPSEVFLKKIVLSIIDVALFNKYEVTFEDDRYYSKGPDIKLPPFKTIKAKKEFESSIFKKQLEISERFVNGRFYNFNNVF